VAVGSACLVGAACAGAHTSSRPHTNTIASPVPKFAQTIVLKPISGRVLVRVPGGPGAFTTLTATRVVPVGTVVDTTAGRVSLTSATPAPAHFQTGQFFLGAFRVEQTRAGGALVSLVLRDKAARSACGAPAPVAGHNAARAAALGARILGLLRGTAKGRFRTVGRFSAATVRGTNWGVRDRCDGTLTVVRSGVVVVTDFRLHRSVIVRAGHTYLAKAP
jgi:hypothetical protein